MAQVYFHAKGENSNLGLPPKALYLPDSELVKVFLLVFLIDLKRHKGRERA
jgi:hypothetical protein